MPKITVASDSRAWTRRHPDLMEALLRWREAKTQPQATAWFDKISTHMSRLLVDEEGHAPAAATTKRARKS